MNDTIPTSQVLLQCPRCSEKHPAYYQEWANATRHLAIIHNDHILHVKYRSGLDIPFLPTMKELKKNKQSVINYNKDIPLF